jgi:hypothetical protein
MEIAVKSAHSNAVSLVSTGKYRRCYYFVTNKGIEREGNKIKIAIQVTKFDVDLNRFDLYEKVRNTANFIRQCNDLPSGERV